MLTIFKKLFGDKHSKDQKELWPIVDEIKEYYVKILNNAQYSEKGGGGLGLIDIKKKTKSNYVYEFYEINENFSFYNLNINIV